MFPLTRDRSRNRSAFGYRPTLNLIFGPNSGDTMDPRITFSRASNATQFDSAGNLVYAPHNLLTFSEQFDNAAWASTDVTLSANNAAAPNGTTTADLVTEGSAGTAIITRSASITVPGGATITGSFYVKRSAVVRWIRFRLSNSAATNGGNVWFDIENGVLGSATNLGSGTNTAGLIESAGDGWYRISVTTTITTADTTGLPLLCSASANSSTTRVSGSAYILWGAQLNVGTIQPYYPTTVKNLLGFAQEFDNAAWTKTASSISATKVTAPDGSVTGQKLVENTANASHFAFQAFTATNVTVTFSAYMKAGERTFGRMQLSNFATGAAQTVFNLSNGTIHVAAVAGGDFTSPVASITSVGNGWYRCSLTAVKGSTNSTIGCTLVLDNGATNIYTGDGTSGIYIWGAQLSDSASLDPYVYNPVAAPTAAAYYGPRFDYDPATLAARGLLIEEQRTNSIRNNTMQGAVAGTPGTLPTNWAVSGLGTLTQTVVGTGTSNGINYIDIRFNGTTSTTSVSIRLEPSGTSGIAATNGQTWAFSAWTAVVAGSTANITQAGLSTNIFDSGGAFLAGIPYVNFFFNTTSTLTRVAPVGTIATVGTAFISPQMYLTFASGVAIDITLRIGLPQLELGAFATSVIPTTTAAATRTADVATMVGANFSNWYNQSEGTIYADARTSITYTGSNQFPYILQVDDGASNNRIYSVTRVLAPYSDSTYVVSVGGASQVNFDTNENDGLLPKANAYKVNDFAFAVGGELETTDTSGSLPVVNRLCLGSQAAVTNFLNGHIRRIAYYPTRLSNAQLQAVTA